MYKVITIQRGTRETKVRWRGKNQIRALTEGVIWHDRGYIVEVVKGRDEIVIAQMS